MAVCGGPSDVCLLESASAGPGVINPDGAYRHDAITLRPTACGVSHLLFVQLFSRCLERMIYPCTMRKRGLRPEEDTVLRSSMGSDYRVRLSTVIALGTLGFACMGARAANLDEVTVTVPGGRMSQAEFPWSRRIGFDPSTSVTTIRIGRDCEFSFVLTAFSAACTSEAVRGDLFDPKYRIPALGIPAPAVPQPSPELLH